MVDRDKLLKDIKEIFNSKPQFFGEGTFYQSFPMLCIDGFRDTKERLENYELEKYLSPDVDILDLGCNCGFFDLEISSLVHTITGVEYNDVLVKIGNTVRDGIGAENVNFYNESYQDWNKKNKKSYDIVFSFAVHRWFGIKPETYALQISSFLKDGGYLFFETQDITGDIWYPKFLREFDCRGFKVIKIGVGYDDRKYYRKFYVLKKEKQSQNRYLINKLKNYRKIYI